ncbi:PilZ domain-containing protein [Microvirga sp. VF16]|uniref:PilZ domain-containing protein n=1 Tax=Microvirga sp. VF16 TaxID=2807101 RepID=UPI00193C9338|nr:PilZ domain-containing protein [Microvirga sp. VF16]
MTREDERRRHRQWPCDYRANALLKGQSLSIVCTVVDISARGARIRFAAAVALPPDFVLVIPSLTLRVDARVVSSRGQHHSVRFTWRMDGPLNAQAMTPRSLQKTLEAESVMFIPENGSRPGVKLPRDRPPAIRMQKKKGER